MLVLKFEKFLFLEKLSSYNTCNCMNIAKKSECQSIAETQNIYEVIVHFLFISGHQTNALVLCPYSPRVTTLMFVMGLLWHWQLRALELVIRYVQ